MTVCRLRLLRDPVAVARWLACDEDAGGGRTAIEDLMLLAGRDLDTCASLQDEVALLHFNGQFSFKNVEELAGSDVTVSNLTCARWHEFFNDAEIGCSDEMPAVAAFSPLVVFGGLRADNLSHREDRCALVAS